MTGINSIQSVISRIWNATSQKANHPTDFSHNYPFPRFSGANASIIGFQAIPMPRCNLCDCADRGAKKKAVYLGGCVGLGLEVVGDEFLMVEGRRNGRVGGWVSVGMITGGIGGDW